MPFFFDPMYLVFLAPALLLAIIAQIRVKSAYAKASKVRVRSGMSGAETAHQILRQNGIDRDIRVEMTQGMLTDHYDSRHRVLRLSPDVYQGRSLAAVGIAAHEVGHALQDVNRYAPLALRNGLVPMAQIGSNGAFLIFFLGMFMQLPLLVNIAIAAFAAVVLFQIVNLPVEFNASTRRAWHHLGQR